MPCRAPAHRSAPRREDWAGPGPQTTCCSRRRPASPVPSWRCRCRRGFRRPADQRPGRQCRRSEEHTSELQSQSNLVCRLLLEKKNYKHPVPRFFVPEHGTMFTLALVRFPPTATKEIQYLNAKGALTYTDIAGDPVLYGNLPPREISMKDVFRSGDSSFFFKIAEGHWYLHSPPYGSPAY